MTLEITPTLGLCLDSSFKQSNIIANPNGISTKLHASGLDFNFVFVFVCWEYGTWIGTSFRELAWD